MEFFVFDPLVYYVSDRECIAWHVWSQRVLSLSNNTVASRGHRFKVFHYDLTLHVPIVMLVMLRSEVI